LDCLFVVRLFRPNAVYMFYYPLEGKSPFYIYRHLRSIGFRSILGVEFDLSLQLDPQEAERLRADGVELSHGMAIVNPPFEFELEAEHVMECMGHQYIEDYEEPAFPHPFIAQNKKPLYSELDWKRRKEALLRDKQLRITNIFWATEPYPREPHTHHPEKESFHSDLLTGNKLAQYNSMLRNLQGELVKRRLRHIKQVRKRLRAAEAAGLPPPASDQTDPMSSNIKILHGLNLTPDDPSLIPVVQRDDPKMWQLPASSGLKLQPMPLRDEDFVQMRVGDEYVKGVSQWDRKRPTTSGPSSGKIVLPISNRRSRTPPTEVLEKVRQAQQPPS